MNDVIITSPLWSLFLFSLLPITIKVLNKNREAPYFISVGLSLVGLCFSIVLLFFLWPSGGEVKEVFLKTLVFNETRAMASLLLFLVGAFVTLMSVGHPQINKKCFSETLFLKLGALIGLLVLLWSGDLLIAFIGLELASLSFYLLIALGKTGPMALRASFKYFILGSVASVILLYGVSFLLGSTGHFDLQKVLQQTPELINSSRLLALALVFICLGFLFKISIFPFHFWLPDVYHSSPTPLLVFMATGLKLTIFVLLFEWTNNTFNQVNFLLPIFQWLAVLSVLFGNIIALLQKDFKKLLLFSTISHSGYLLMILLAHQMGLAGRVSLFYYLLMYLIMTLGVFMCLREKEGQAGLSLEELKGLASKNPLYAFLISVFLLSLAGVPPTGGFVAKLFLFQALLDQGFWWMLFWTILGSSLALYYYLKPITLMYMKSQKNPTLKQNNIKQNNTWFITFVIILLATLVFIGGLAPSLLAGVF